MVKRIVGISALLGALALVAVMQDDNSSSSNGAGIDSALAEGDTIKIADSWALTGVVNVDLGYKLNVMSGDYEHKTMQGLLLSDGSVFRDIPRLHLDDFDVDKSRQEDPSKWGEWQIDGDTLSIRWNGKNGTLGDWADYENWFLFENPKAGEALAGSYKNLNTSSSSTGSKEFFATGWSTVTFDESGRFAETSGGSVTAGASDSATNDGGLSLTTGGSDSMMGNYEVTATGINFSFDDGSTRENSIFYSSSEKKVILINGVKFIRN